MFAPAERHAKRARLAGLGTLLLTLLSVPASAQEKPGGPEVWGANCGRCHRPRAIDAYDARHWATIVTHMSLVARLTPDETQAVEEFLIGAARARDRGSDGASAAGTEPALLASLAPAPEWRPCCDPVVGRALYKSECAVCHGEKGRGDGTVATAMTPRPADLTDSVRMRRLTVDSLVQIVTKGRGAMPGFEADLNAEQVREVVEYIRSLRK